MVFLRSGHKKNVEILCKVSKTHIFVNSLAKDGEMW